MFIPAGDVTDSLEGGRADDGGERGQGPQQQVQRAVLQKQLATTWTDLLTNFNESQASQSGPSDSSHSTGACKCAWVLVILS